MVIIVPENNVLPIVKESIGYLAVQVLAAKFDLSTMKYEEMLHELWNITVDLQAAAEDSLPRQKSK